MITKAISLFYGVTPDKILPPSSIDIARKDKWIKDLQQTIPSEAEYEMIKVTYELYNPHIADLMRFFNGTVVAYYAIQNEDMTEGEPSSEMLKQYREEMLDELLGYDYKTVNKVIRKRESTADFKTVQKWNNLVKLTEETLFANAGYEFPNSEAFWELAKKIGYDNARTESIKKLQHNILKKHESN